MIIDLVRWPGPDGYENPIADAGAAFHKFMNQYVNSVVQPQKTLMISPAMHSKLAALGQLQAFTNSVHALGASLAQFDTSVHKAMDDWDDPDDGVPAPETNPKNHGPKPKNKGPRPAMAFTRGGKKRF